MEDVAAAFDLLAAALHVDCGAARGPVLAFARMHLMGMAQAKKAAEPHLWTPDVAKGFGRCLRAAPKGSLLKSPAATMATVHAGGKPSPPPPRDVVDTSRCHVRVAIGSPDVWSSAGDDAGAKRGEDAGGGAGERGEDAPSVSFEVAPAGTSSRGGCGGGEGGRRGSCVCVRGVVG